MPHVAGYKEDNCFNVPGLSPASAKQGLCEQISPSPGASDSSHLKGDNKISVASSWWRLHKMKESLRTPLFPGPETWEVPTASALAASWAHLHAWPWPCIFLHSHPSFWVLGSSKTTHSSARSREDQTTLKCTLWDTSKNPFKIDPLQKRLCLK